MNIQCSDLTKMQGEVDMSVRFCYLCPRAKLGFTASETRKIPGNAVEKPEHDVGTLSKVTRFMVSQSHRLTPLTGKASQRVACCHSGVERLKGLEF